MYVLGWVFLYFSKLSIKHGSSYFEKTRNRFFKSCLTAATRAGSCEKAGNVTQEWGNKRRMISLMSHD